jgi:hypothetical protein
MNQPAVRIEELRLRVPGLDQGQAGQLAEQVAQQLAKELPALTASHRIPTLHLRVNASQGTTRAQLASRIVSNIARSLR